LLPWRVAATPHDLSLAQMATVLRPSRPSACATMRPVHANSPLRRLVPLAAAAVVAVALSACGNSSAPSTHPSGAGATHKTSTSTAASRSATSASSTTTTPAPTAPTAPTTPAPQEVTFSPFTAQGAVAQGLQATQQVSGHCTSPGGGHGRRGLVPVRRRAR
jgi:hypothetical protein